MKIMLRASGEGEKKSMGKFLLGAFLCGYDYTYIF